ncbi:MAG: peptide ABC transporter substrate-binding protein, partial [Leptospirales bacterium]
ARLWESRTPPESSRGEPFWLPPFSFSLALPLPFSAFSIVLAARSFMAPSSLLRFFLFCSLGPFLFACSPHFNPLPSNNSNSTLVVSLSDDPSTLDWNKATDGISLEVVSNLMAGLTRFDRNLNVVPNLAERWKSNRTKTVFTFYLEKGRYWSDGKPVTANDFKDSFLRLLAPGTASPYAYYLFDIKGARCFHAAQCPSSAVKIDAATPGRLVVFLSHPMAPFPSLLTNPITDPVRMDLIQKYGNHWTDPAHLVTDGNYLLKRWDHGSIVELVARKDFGHSSIRRILFLIIPEPVTQLLLYEKHVLDIAGVPSFYVKKYRKDPGFHQILQFSNLYYSLNVKRPPFDNIHVRKAFALAVDRNGLYRLFKGAIPVSRSFIPKGLLGYDPDSSYGFHPDQARGELAKGGFSGGKGFPRVTLFFPNGTQSRILAVYMQRQFQQVLGITVHLRSLEWKAFLARLDSRTPSIYQSGWMADYPDPNTFMTLMTKGSGNNRTGWSDPEFDRLVVKAVSSRKKSEREAIYKRAQTILTQEGIPVLPLTQGLTNLLIRKNIQGFWHDPLGNDHFEELKKS